MINSTNPTGIVQPVSLVHYQPIAAAGSGDPIVSTNSGGLDHASTNDGGGGHHSSNDNSHDGRSHSDSTHHKSSSSSNHDNNDHGGVRLSSWKVLIHHS